MEIASSHDDDGNGSTAFGGSRYVAQGFGEHI
jgi:hypothetical protein